MSSSSRDATCISPHAAGAAPIEVVVESVEDVWDVWGVDAAPRAASASARTAAIGRTSALSSNAHVH